MAAILAIGCTGMIGKRLLPELLARGHELRVLTRDPPRARTNLRSYLAAQGQTEAAITDLLGQIAWQAWPGGSSELDPAWISDRDTVINLAGAGIADKRWTDARKQVLHDSRIGPSEMIARCARKHGVQTLINASAIGWYGWPTQAVDESAPAGHTYLAELTGAWEAAVHSGLQSEASSAAVRCVLLRIGVVLGAEGGALKQMVRPYIPLAHLGSGDQPFAWIHRDDVVGMICEAVVNPAWNGPVNAVAPATDSLKSVMLALKVATGKFLLPLGAPAWVLRLLLGEMADMVLNGVTVTPARAQQWDYVWQHPNIDAAAAACYPNGRV